MSLRPGTTTGKGTPLGSLFGPAINAPPDGFWSRLAVTPPRSPPTLPFGAQALEQFLLDADVEMTCNLLPRLPSVATDLRAEDAHEVRTLQSVCPTWAYDFDNEAALVVFDHEPGGHVKICTTPRRVLNRDPVTAKVVSVDGLSWRPMVYPSTLASAGYAFSLTKAGSVVCKVEVTLNNNELARVAIVQTSYAPIAMAAELADRSSLLVYDEPQVHIQKLQEVRSNLGVDADLGYAPVSECCVTSSFGRLELSVPLGSSYTERATFEAAKRVWNQTRDFLKRLSTVTADCIDKYTENEIQRVGAYEIKPQYKSWRAVVV